jgi:hypothetical protein
MNIATLFWAICIGGAIGGLLGELVEGGLMLPHRNPDGSLDLGLFKNILFGAAAGAVSQLDALKQTNISATGSLTSGLGALLIGIGGANWIKSKADTKTMQSAAAVLANKPADQQVSTQILAAKSARECLQIANQV